MDPQHVPTDSCPHVMFYYPHELSYNIPDTVKYFRENWSVVYVAIAIYLFAICYGQKYMENRKPYNLKWPLFVWNLSLAIFSLAGTHRAIIEFTNLLTTHDVYTTVCVTDNAPGCNARAYWMALFTFSKIAEFGDTAFIILRKRKLIFLHWYHHVTVLFLSWACAAEGVSFGRYFLAINFAIHTLMYTYYALQSVGIKPSRIISMTITSLQILQMVAGIFVVIYGANQYNNGRHCETNRSAIRCALIVYGSYFVLFVHFFLQAYVYGKKPTSSLRSSSRGQMIHSSYDINANVKSAVKSD